MHAQHLQECTDVTAYFQTLLTIEAVIVTSEDSLVGGW